MAVVIHVHDGILPVFLLHDLCRLYWRPYVLLQLHGMGGRVAQHRYLLGKSPQHVQHIDSRRLGEHLSH